ncbi:MAG: hypothetical protein KIS88_05250 [Anaerolineales bacterium]|nr:hypothetical protein [Anaerolineales bacterium]
MARRLLLLLTFVLLTALLIPSDTLAAPLRAPVVRTLDGSGGLNVGIGPSLVLDAYQRPVIAYSDTSGTALKLAYCDDPECSTWVANKVDDAGTGSYASLQLTSAGLPVISYRRGNNLYLAMCATPACEPGSVTVKTLDNRTGGTVGGYTSLQLDANERPILSYSRTAGTNVGLWVAYCSDADCASVTLNRVGDTAGVNYTSMKLNSSGNPVIAYEAASNVRLVTCTAPDCGTFNAFQIIDTGGQNGGDISLQLDASGLPRAVYYNGDSNEIRLLLCSTAACTSGNRSLVSLPDTSLSNATSLVLDGSGNPVFTYGDLRSTANQLKLTRCSDASCSASLTTVLDPVRTFSTSLALDCAGNPVVAYYAAIAQDLKLYVDDSSGCAPVPPTPGGSSGNADGSGSSVSQSANTPMLPVASPACSWAACW